MCPHVPRGLVPALETRLEYSFVWFQQPAEALWRGRVVLTSLKHLQGREGVNLQ